MGLKLNGQGVSYSESLHNKHKYYLYHQEFYEIPIKTCSSANYLNFKKREMKEPPSNKQLIKKHQNPTMSNANMKRHTSAIFASP